MKASELRELSNQELDNEVLTLKEELFNLRFEQATGQITNSARIKTVRKDIARIKTILTERQIAESK